MKMIFNVITHEVQKKLEPYETFWEQTLKIETISRSYNILASLPNIWKGQKI